MSKTKECWSCKDGYPIQVLLRGDEVACAKCRKPVPETLQTEYDDECAVKMEEALEAGIVRIGGGLTKHGLGKNWGDGKVISQLPMGHPDRMVSSERQMRENCEKHGIDVGTGKFKSEQLKQRAWNRAHTAHNLRKNGRLSVTPGKFGEKLR